MDAAWRLEERVDDTKLQMLLERIEVPVVVKQ
jgi:hypothetical protein